MDNLKERICLIYCWSYFFSTAINFGIFYYFYIAWWYIYWIQNGHRKVMFKTQSFFLLLIWPTHLLDILRSALNPAFYPGWHLIFDMLFQNAVSVQQVWVCQKTDNWPSPADAVDWRISFDSRSTNKLLKKVNANKVIHFWHPITYYTCKRAAKQII